MNHGDHNYQGQENASTALRALLLGLLAILLMTLALAPPAKAELAGSGPVDPSNGYPYWYEDEDGLRLDLCLDPQDQRCLQPFEMPDPGGPVSFPDNFPGEAFWWIAEAETTTDTGADALLSMAMESAWGGPGEAVRDGDQISFGRTRIRVDDLNVGSEYRVIHPYGIKEFGPLADDDGDGVGEINYTADMGCLTGAINPCDFEEATKGEIGPFLTWDTFGADDPLLRSSTGEPNAYVGDPDVPHAVTGSPENTNFFEVQERNAVGEWVTIARTDQFSVAGKVATPQVKASHRDDLYNSNQNVELIPSDPSYDVYYTEDGTDPTTSSTPYSGPVLVDAAQGAREETTLRFIAVDSETGRQSDVMERTYAIDQSAPHLISSVPGGTYEDIPDADGDGAPDTVKLSIEQDPADPTNVRTAEIVYTTDGSAPEAQRNENGELTITNGQAYPEAGVEMERSATLRAIAVDDAGNQSRVETFVYKIAALKATGPINPIGNYPFWYEDKGMDTRGPLRLDMCLDPQDPKCLQPFESPNPGNPVSFPDNFPGEAFWWTGEADLPLPNSDKALLVMAHEAAWGGPDEAVRDGDQIVFGRIRVRIDGLQLGREYRVSHPYGTDTYIAEDDGKGAGEINATEDLGCGELGPVTRCDFNEARFGRVGPFLTWDTFGQGTDPALAGPNGEPDAYVGDPNVLHSVTGSPITDAAGTAQNYFKLERRTQNGGWEEVAQTDQFAVSGKVSQLQVAPSVQGGIFNEAQTLSLAASDPQARIFFTTNGAAPTQTSAQFDPNDPIRIASDTTLKFIAVDAAGNESDVFTQNYVIDTQAPTVAATPGPGTFNGPQLVTLTANDGNAAANGANTLRAARANVAALSGSDGDSSDGSSDVPPPSTLVNETKIYYTTDGSQPTTESAVYTAPIRVSRTQTIEALAVDAAGNRSNVASFEYVIDAVAPSATASLDSGTFASAQQVALESDDPSDKIHYTTDGSEPSTSSKAYEGPISITRTTTLRFFAIDAAGNRSETLTREYVIRTASSVSLNVSKATLKLGKSRAISGKVGPAHAGETVRVTVERNGRPVLNRNLRLNGASAYSLNYRPKSVGRYTVQVRFAGDEDHTPAASALKSFRVVRR
jgi:hypothetical protein